MSHTVVNKQSNRLRSNVKLARGLWGALQPLALTRLRELTGKYGFSVAAGDLQFLEGRWYVTHAGLLRLACRKKCLGIRTTLQKALSDPSSHRWVFKAVVFTSPGSRGFIGHGDASPENVSPLVQGAEMRVAETRAVCRALRAGYGLGVCSVEELGYLSSPPEPAARKGIASSHSNGNGSGNGQPRLRDRLCLLIRQHQLDPTLVKRYAADFCGTQELREARRELVESFINHLADWAARDRSGLLSKLNSFAPSQEVPS